MNPSKEILNIIESKKEADKKFNETVRLRLTRLANVANSVFRKAGMYKALLTNEDIEKHFPLETHWLFEWFETRSLYTVVTSADEDFIHCSRHGVKQNFDFKIDTSVLALSDRDFAKLIRQGIKSYREHKSSQEYFARIKHIADMKNAIESMQETIAKEENLAKEYTLNQERLINESAERTRASHAKRMESRRRAKEMKEKSLTETVSQ